MKEMFGSEQKKKQPEKQDKKEEEDKDDGTDIIKKLIKHDQEQFQTTRLFDKAQYNQCVPNP